MGCLALTACAPEPSAQAPRPLVDHSNLAAGRTPTAFAVTETGAATYRIAVELPPGIGALKPELGIAYNSQGGASALGVGFSLSGLSAISRCPPKYGTVGYSAPISRQASTDRLCLDGQELKLVSGTYLGAGSVYRTEVESFARVEASASLTGNGPTSFTVTSKNGFSSTFGGSSEARVPQDGSTVLVWSLSSVRDRAGNRIEYAYEANADNVARLTAIRWPYTATGEGPFYEARLEYGPRAVRAASTAFVDGLALFDGRQLDRLSVHRLPATELRHYSFTYAESPATGRSLLTDVQECGPTSCRPEVHLDYEQAAPGYAAANGPTLGPIGAQVGTQFFGDFNHDGQTDLLWCYGLSESWRGRCNWTLRLSVSGVPRADTVLQPFPLIGRTDHRPLVGNFSGIGPTQVLVPYENLTVAGPLNYGLFEYDRLAGSLVFREWSGIFATPRTTAADFDADGLTDLLFPTASSIGLRRNVTVPGGPLTFAPEVTLYTVPAGYVLGAPWSQGVELADFNHDGRADLLVSERLSSGGDCTDPLTAVSACAMRSRVFYTDALTPSGPALRPGPVFVDRPVWGVSVLDFNGDGCSDLVVNDKWPTPATVEVSNCRDAFASRPLVALQSYRYTRPLVIDYDGDGRQDLLYTAYETTSRNDVFDQILRSVADGYAVFTLPAPLQGPSNPSVIGWRAQAYDFDADGRQDVAFQPGLLISNARMTLTMPLVHRADPRVPDRARAFTNGRGYRHEVEYLPLSAGGGFYGGQLLAFPLVQFTAPLSVVSSYSAPTGIDAFSLYHVSYRWRGAAYHLQGRGFLGFANVSATDSRNGITVEKTFEQNFPKTGRLSTLEKYSAFEGSRKDHHRVTTPWAAQRLAGPSGAEDRFLVQSPVRQVDDFELPEQDHSPTRRLRSTVTYFGFDAFGNVSSSTQVVRDEDVGSPKYGQSWRHVETVDYDNAESSWCLGLPNRRTVTDTAPGQRAMTRTTTWTNDLVACRATSQVQEPDDLTLRSDVTFGFDGCGNVTTTTVVGRQGGWPLSPRVTTTGFGTRCQFAETVTNPVGERLTITYDPDFGLPATATDANGLTTTTTYDEWGRKVRESRPDGTSSRWAYARYATGPYSQRIDTTSLDATGAWVTNGETYLDALDRPKVRFSKHGLNAGGWTRDEQLSYDGLGRVVLRDLPVLSGYASGASAYELYRYDLYDRLVETTRYDDFGVLLERRATEYRGFSRTQVDANGHRTVHFGAASGNVYRSVEPTGATTWFEFDSLGHTIHQGPSIPLASGGGGKKLSFSNHSTLRSFDVLGRLLSESHPDKGTRRFTYDSLGALVESVDAKGQVTSLDHDDLGRVIRRTSPDHIAAFVYGSSPAAHDVGKLVSAEGSDGYRETRAYDGFGRLASSTTRIDHVEYPYDYAYDAAGRVKTTTWPAFGAAPRFSVTTHYELDRLAELRDDNGFVLWRASEADAFGQVRSESAFVPGLFAEPLVVTRSFDAASGLLRRVMAGTPASPVMAQNLRYTWDAEHNLRAREDLRQSLTEGFTYDAVNRLVETRLNGAVTLEASYDGVGNLLRRSDVGLYAYDDPTHVHAATRAGSHAFSYDANGNLVGRDADVQEWSAFDLPTVVRRGGESSRFAYSPTKERYKEVRSSGLSTLWVGPMEQLEQNGQTTVRYTVATPGATQLVVERSSAQPSVRRYSRLLMDHLGSLDVVMGDAQVEVRASFGPFGERRDELWQGQPSAAKVAQLSAVTGSGFTGHVQLDGLGLVHMGGRVYDPSLGRFWSADPLPPQSLQSNPYAYVANRPLSATDPTGLSEDSVGGSFGSSWGSSFGGSFGDSFGSSWGSSFGSSWGGASTWGEGSFTGLVGASGGGNAQVSYGEDGTVTFTITGSRTAAALTTSTSVLQTLRNFVDGWDLAVGADRMRGTSVLEAPWDAAGFQSGYDVASTGKAFVEVLKPFMLLFATAKAAPLYICNNCVAIGFRAGGFGRLAAEAEFRNVIGGQQGVYVESLMKEMGVGMERLGTLSQGVADPLAARTIQEVALGTRPQVYLLHEVTPEMGHLMTYSQRMSSWDMQLWMSLPNSSRNGIFFWPKP